MSKNLFLSIALTLVLLLSASPSFAGSAELLLSPTRIVLDDGNKYARVTVRNNGDGVGRYKIELVDTIMTENGGITLRKDGKKNKNSALNLLSLSPRGMTLQPNGNQTVRILAKKLKDLPDGEYRTHLQVRMTETDLDIKTGKAAARGAGVILRPKMTTVIPLIIRKGDTNFKISMDDAKLVMGGDSKNPVPQIQTSFSFSGNRSVLGDIKVVHVAPNGTETQILFFRGIAIYRDVSKRTQIVSLKVPKGLNIHSGKLLVSFMSQEREGSQVLTSKEITP